MKEYNPQKIEKKWQKKWEKSDLYKAKDFVKKPKKYILVEFPYPSGDGLHVGHTRSYSALDAIARKKRMEGFNVLYPIGWDAFGLPTENYAIRTGIHPRQATDKNIKIFRKQLKSLGLSFDWSREIDTTDPKYYKWTQWIFLKFFENGLAYQAEMPINWCPSCKIGLANEEVIDGKCERCGAPAGRKKLKQWLLKITVYADKLIKGLEDVDYPARVKASQVNWIGRSEGVKVDFKLVILNDSEESHKRGKSSSKRFLSPRCRFGEAGGLRSQDDNKIVIFTTRVDTIFCVTALVLAPEHEIIKNLKLKIKNWPEVTKYIEQAKKKSELERTSEIKERTGIELKGVIAINPANDEQVPVWIADYVIPTYGGGAVMMVPAHDKRDWDFAKKYKLPIKEVVSGGDVEKGAYIDYGILINYSKFNGMPSEEAIKEIAKWLEGRKLGRRKVEYKLRDWIFSRQHYWGEPIPLIFCENCAALISGGRTSQKLKFSKGELLNPGWIAVPENKLPIELPYVEKYQPTDTGESPLANVKNWINTKCPKCKGPAKRETDTMPNWAGSSWYFLRYIDPRNEKVFADFKKLEYWLQVDLYNGGMEHTTLHLLYSRFWHKFLYDLKLVPTPEPYAKRTSHGIVLAEDRRKMSKSFGNIINPDEIVKIYGADTLRIYEMFMGPFDQAISWNHTGLVGCYRFLERIYNYILGGFAHSPFYNENDLKQWISGRIKVDTPREIKILLNKTIKKVEEDLENLKFNTAISQLMMLRNSFYKEEDDAAPILTKSRIGPSKTGRIIAKADFEKFLILLSPFAPHLAEELWQKLGHKKSIFYEKWPKYDPKLIKEETFELVIQINGRVRDKISAAIDISEDEAKELALESEKVQKWIKDKTIKKVIFVKNRLINFIF